MNNYVKIKTKILLPLSVLILIVLILTTSLISYEYTKAQALRELKNSIALAVDISKLVHSTQKERGLTSAYLTSKDPLFYMKLLQQRKVTDERLLHVEVFSHSIKNRDIVGKLHALLNTKKLNELRKKVDSHRLTLLDAIRFYSDLNDRFLNIIVEISKISQISSITQNIIAYSSFLYAKENAGIERAVGVSIISKTITTHYIDQNLRVYFTNLIAIEKLYMKTFLRYVSNDAQKYFHTQYRDPVVIQVDKMRRTILYGDVTEIAKIKPDYWFSIMTKKIDVLQAIDNYLEKEILKNISNELATTYKFFGGFAIVNILSISIFLLMMIIIVSLIKSEKRLKNIIDKYIISSTTDLKGNIIDVSDAFCKISGYSREELIGKPHNIIRHRDMPKSAFRELWDTIESGKSWSGKVKNLKKDGGYYWVYAHIEPLFNRSGKIEGYAAIRIDITDSIHLEEELERSKQKDKTLLQQSKLAQMGEMISMIAHQWRQPLTAISSTASDLHLKVILNNYNEVYFNEKLEKIDDFSQHLSKTIDDFRNFYKEDKEKKLASCADIIDGALNIVSSSLESKDIEIITHYECKELIYTFPNELRQVILNIIKNAEDALIEQGVAEPRIEIKTYAEGKFSIISICDNAGGIPQTIMENIFDPYFSTKTKKDGTGLGLYMSKIIIEDHCNGELIVRNGKEGAEFLLKIPQVKDEK